jgi:hypothetical protein
MAKKHILTETKQKQERITVELNFCVARGEAIFVELDEEDSRSWRQYCEEYGFPPEVFSDMEDE